MTPEQFAQQSACKPWITTYTGRRVNPLNLQVEDIDILDIAHHLATINRWCGALREPISVAQHSVHVSWLCDGTGAELEALLHDASEAYLGDVTKWLKGSEAMAAFREAEDRAITVICRKFDMPILFDHSVEDADKLMIGIEGQFGIPGWTPFPGYQLPTFEILQRARFYGQAWSWQKAKAVFISRFEELNAR